MGGGLFCEVMHFISFLLSVTLFIAQFHLLQDVSLFSCIIFCYLLIFPEFHGEGLLSAGVPSALRTSGR